MIKHKTSFKEKENKLRKIKKKIKNYSLNNNKNIRKLLSCGEKTKKFPYSRQKQNIKFLTLFMIKKMKLKKYLIKFNKTKKIKKNNKFGLFLFKTI